MAAGSPASPRVAPAPRGRFGRLAATLLSAALLPLSAGLAFGADGLDTTPAKVLFSKVNTPIPMEARSIGSYAKGCLAGAVALPVNGPDWQAMRLSPLDAMRCVPQGIVGFANFLAGRHEQAVAAGRRAVEMTPGFSILHGWLAAPLARLGRIEEAKAAGARLMALDPHFFVGRWSAAVGLAPAIRDDVTDALRQAGLPA